MKSVLARFVEWSHDHAGAPCPDTAALGVVALDPWGHPIDLTCTGQPADQRVGVVSSGPDGIAGTGDDVASWVLGREVTDLVRGARWQPAATAAAPAPRPPSIRRRKDGSLSRDPVPVTQPDSAEPAGAAGAAPPVATAPPPASTLSKKPPPPIDAGGDDIPSRR
jgi:hypothetical protein